MSQKGAAPSAWIQDSEDTGMEMQMAYLTEQAVSQLTAFTQ